MGNGEVGSLEEGGCCRHDGDERDCRIAEVAPPEVPAPIGTNANIVIDFVGSS